MQKLFQDPTVEEMVISNQLALELFGGNNEKWIKINPCVITDHEGRKHTCTHVIKVSWRWGTQFSTRDNTVYISPRLHAQTSENGKTASGGMLDLLVPERYDSNDSGPPAPGISPVFQLHPQTLGMCPFLSPTTIVKFGEGVDKNIAYVQAEDKDRQRNNNQAAQQSNEKATEAARRKKEKEFQAIATKPK
jgi:hypothetical protein